MKDLYNKLFQITSTMDKMKKDSENPFFKSKYFDVNQLIEALRPEFIKHDLLLLQPIENGRVKTQIIDIKTGDKVEAELELSQSSKPQDTGSEITYYRRYTLQSLLGIEAEDDDGNRASGNTTKKKDEPQKAWLNETDKEKWAAAEDWVRAGNHPSTLRKKYALNKLNYGYFESIYNEVNK